MSAYTDELTTLGVTSHIRLDDTTGTTATADVGADTMTYGSGVTLNQTGGGDDGNAAVSMDGSSSQNYIYTHAPTDGVSFDDDTRHARSVFVTVNLDVLNKDQMILQYGGKAAGLFLYQFATDSKLYLNFTNGSAANISGNASALTATTWHSITVVQDDSNDNIHAYVDGSLSYTVDITSGTSEELPDSVILGDAEAGGGASKNARLHDDSTKSDRSMEVDGLIGEYAYFSNIVLSSSEVSTLHDKWLNGVATGITGTGSYTSPATTYAGTGSVIITGTGSYTSPATTYSSTGTVIITGTGSYTKPATTYGSTGFLGVYGSGSYTSPTSTYAGTGTVIISGTGSYTMPFPVYSSTGIILLEGTGNYTGPFPTYSGSGVLNAISGTGAYTSPVSTYSGIGGVIVKGTGSYTSPTTTYSGTGVVIITGSGSYVAPVSTYAGSGIAGAAIVGTGAYSTPIPTYSGTGQLTLTGTGSYTMPFPLYQGQQSVIVALDPFVLPAYDGIMTLPAYDGIIILPKTE